MEDLYHMKYKIVRDKRETALLAVLVDLLES